MLERELLALHRPPTASPARVLGEADLRAIRYAGLAPAQEPSTPDHPLIAHRDGDLVAWGFHDPSNPDMLRLSTAQDLEGSELFVNEQLSAEERDAFTMYTDGEFKDINAAYTGREPHPETYIQEWQTELDSAFAKKGAHNDSSEPVTMIRGAAIPPGYGGDLQDFLSATYPVGAPVQFTKVTSFSTKQTVAESFTARKTGGYLMVVRTREGIALRSVAVIPAEEEVVMGPGSRLRTVRVDSTGINSMPTVYLVSEDLIEAETAPV